MDRIGLLVIPGLFFGGCFLVKKCYDDIMQVQEDVSKAKDEVIVAQKTLIELQDEHIKLLKQGKESQEKKS